ncbi:MAG TPA: GNAT family N-acetyltransferase [Actinomycetota bacterium]|nr:GNAT family N-acetyltransferase [Actinomycetota bacterium]
MGASSLDFVLRPARPQDGPEISEAFLAARRDALPDLPKIHTDDEVRTWIREVVLPKTTVWVAEADGEVVGFFSLDGQTLTNMYVHPDHQGLKVGTALLEQARALSPERLRLFTFARNEGARRFYERYGFRAIAFGQDNEETEPDVLYEWTS